MIVARAFPTPVSASEAVAIQKTLRDQVVREGSVKPRIVAGADVSYKGDVARAVFVVMRGLELLEKVVVDEDVPFPYIPGLLSFREIPPLLSAWKRLRTRPDVIIVDGQGIAHPRRVGIASHLGLVLGVPDGMGGAVRGAFQALNVACTGLAQSDAAAPFSVVFMNR